MPAPFYRGWGQGHIATTSRVKGSWFKNHEQMNAYCKSMIGEGWQVADAMNWSKWIPGMNGTRYTGSEWTANSNRMIIGGWSFYAYGNVRNDMRFWFYSPAVQRINCWDD